MDQCRIKLTGERFVNTASALRLAYLSVCRRFRFGHGVGDVLQLHDKDCVNIERVIKLL